MKHIENFIHNSLDFLIKFLREVDENTKRVTFDVIRFYTRIPPEFGVKVLNYFLITYQEDLHPRFKKEFVLELANFILKSNTLAFDSEFYLQIDTKFNKSTVLQKSVWIFAATLHNQNDMSYLLQTHHIIV